MELDKIQLQTTWNDAAGSINQNFAKLVLAITALQAEGGGLDESQLEQYLTENGYTKQDWVLAQKYITLAALEGFATEDWVNQQKFLKSVEGSAFISVSPDNIISLDVDEQGGLGATEQGLGIVSIPDGVLEDNLKTINGESIVGTGNIIIQGGGGGIVSESDPIFKASPAAKITDEDIERWNSNEGADIVIDTEMSDTSENAVQNKVIKEYVDLHPRYETIEEIVPPEEVEDFATKEWARQTFTEPSDFKTINGQSIVGEGDIELNGGKVTLDTEMSDESENGVQNKVIKAYVDGKVETISTANLINVTYDEMLHKCMEGTLVKGARYRMTDYETTTIQEGTRSAKKGFDIVLTAIDEWLPSEDAIAIDKESGSSNSASGWVTGWHIKYALVPFLPSVRFLWSARGNEYIVRNVETDGVVFEELTFCRFSATYTEDFNGKQCYLYFSMIYPYGFIAFSEKAELQVGDEIILSTGVVFTIDEVVSREDGKGCIYEMTDEWGNSAPYDFKNIQFRVYSPNAGAILPTYTFVKEEGMTELWAYTFWGGGDEDSSTIGKLHYPYKIGEVWLEANYNVCNNKIRYFPYRLQPLVACVATIETRDDSSRYINVSCHDNEFINCDRLISGVGSNSVLRNCENVVFDVSNEMVQNIHIDCLKGTEGNPIVIENLTTSSEYTTHIGKNSQGEVKIWNPADLV